MGGGKKKLEVDLDKDEIVVPTLVPTGDEDVVFDSADVVASEVTRALADLVKDSFVDRLVRDFPETANQLLEKLAKGKQLVAADLAGFPPLGIKAGGSSASEEGCSSSELVSGEISAPLTERDGEALFSQVPDETVAESRKVPASAPTKKSVFHYGPPVSGRVIDHERRIAKEFASTGDFSSLDIGREPHVLLRQDLSGFAADDEAQTAHSGRLRTAAQRAAMGGVTAESVDMDWDL